MKAQRLLRAKTTLSRLMAPNTSCPNHFLEFGEIGFFFFFLDYFLNLIFKTRVQQDKSNSNCTLDPPHSLFFIQFSSCCVHSSVLTSSRMVCCQFCSCQLLHAHDQYSCLCSNLKVSRHFSHIFNLEVKGMYLSEEIILVKQAQNKRGACSNNCIAGKKGL